MADERLAVIANGAGNANARHVLGAVLDQTAARGLVHALGHPARATHNDLLEHAAKVAKGSILLRTLTIVALHQRITRVNGQAPISRADLALPLSLTLGLFTRATLFLWHFLTISELTKKLN